MNKLIRNGLISTFVNCCKNYKMSYSTSIIDDNILIERFNNIVTIGINRPSKRNCLDLKTAGLLKKAIEEFENDDNSFAAVLYGTGGNFCSGFDLNEFTNMQEEKMDKLFNEGLMALPKCVKKPMVAAINGYAVAGGLELALLCDLRVMEETAILGLYGRRFGIPLTDGGTVRLQAIVGLTRALDMVLTGRSVNAKDAFEWGLVNRIVACGTALGQAINLAISLVKFPQDCLLIDREATYDAAYNKVYDDLLKEERKHSKSVVIKHAIEGAKRFLSGVGKHGKFYNLTNKEIQEWEKEFNSQSEKISKSKRPASKL